MTWDRMGQVTTNTRNKATQIVAWSAKQGRPLHVLWGKDSNPKNTEHYSGRAVDFMTFADPKLSRHDRAIGDGIVDYLLAHRDQFGVQGIIWRQRLIGYSDTKFARWRPMADRGTATANHMDHVHVLFSAADKAAVPPAPAPAAAPAKTPAPKGTLYHVDPAKVKTFLWGLKGGTKQNIKAKPRRPIRIVRWANKRGRKWGVTAYDNWFAAEYLKKGSPS